MNELGGVEPHDLSGYSRTTYKQLLPCPLCDGLTGVEMVLENLPVIGLGRVPVGYGFCCVCGHIYQTTPPHADTLEKYYSQFSNYAGRKQAIEPSAMTRRLMDLGRLKPGMKVYEVGCATGDHLSWIREAGCEVGGCEPSQAACDKAKEFYGLAIDCGLERDFLPRQMGLNLVLFSGVLEHLPDPVWALKRAKTALAPDGHVLLEVPCATSPESLPPGWLAFEHLHYYTPHAVKRLLELSGFELLEARISYRDFIYPVITAIGRKASKILNARDGDATASREFIKTYMDRDNAFWAKAAQKINELPPDLDEDLVIWGAGIHTSQLLDRLPTLSRRVKYIVDRDPQKWGKQIAGLDVLEPGTYIRGVMGPFMDQTMLLVSSYANEMDIVKELAASDVPESLIIRLYN